jgi:hypothetical protein
MTRRPTDAHGDHPPVPQRQAPPPPPSRLFLRWHDATWTTVTGLLVMALGAWLWVARSVLNYPFNDARTDAFLNEALGAAVLLSTGFVRATRVTRRMPRLAAVQAGVGVWLILAPRLIGYAAGAPEAGTNHTVCGGLAVLLAVAGWLTADPSSDRAGAPAPVRMVRPKKRP